MIKRINDNDELALLAESIFSGIVKSKKEKDNDDDDTEEKDNKEETDSDDDGEESFKKSKKDDDKEDDEDSDEEKDEESDEDESEDGEEKGEKSSAKEKSPAKSKLKALQSQYNDLLIDLFDKYSVECIECALEDSESTFGENIEGILDSALNGLKAKIMEELGVEPGAGIEAEGGFDEIVTGEKPEAIEGEEEVVDGEEETEEGDGEEPTVMPPAAMGSFDPDVAKKYPMEIRI